MLLSDLQHKDIINMYDGKNVGKIIDVEITPEGHIVNLIVVPATLFKSIISSSKGTYISYYQIKKIGEDVILVDI